jgi:hypothetical protein
VANLANLLEFQDQEADDANDGVAIGNPRPFKIETEDALTGKMVSYRTQASGDQHLRWKFLKVDFWQDP